MSNNTTMITNRFGNTLLGVELGDETSLLTSRSPVTASLVIADHEGSFLFGFNRYRRQWEAPAGRIEPGETPRDCAARELLEESCQIAGFLDFIGLAEITRPSGQRKYSALYATSLTDVTEFTENGEWIRMCFWDLAAHIGNVDEVDYAIVRRWLAAA